MDRNELISKIVAIELDFFQNTKSLGGPAPCQSQIQTFVLARTGQWNLYPTAVLESYLHDLENALTHHQNLITLKYAYMMKTTSPAEYENIKDKLPVISQEKENMVNAIVLINMFWEEELRRKHPELINKNRPLYTHEDDDRRVSVETYLRGELLTYGNKTLNLLLDYYKKCFDEKKNLVYENLKFLSEKKNHTVKCNLKKECKKTDIKCGTLTLKDAEILKDFAIQKANEIGIGVTITVLDTTGNILLTARMDDAIIASIEISKNKAFTAFSLRKDTYHLQINENLKNINMQRINGFTLCFLGGGFPVQINDKFIGAIGISGGAVSQDIEIAETAIRKFKELIK